MSASHDSPPAVSSALRSVALIGNPNTGKSTLFNALSGLRAKTGNYPGVTVEKKIGRVTWNSRRIDLVDLPGTYSLSPRSPDEMVSVDVLLGRQAGAPPVDAVVCVVDASNLERNLYLVSQVLDLGLPTVLALNMVDVAAAKGIEIDIPALSRRLGVPVVATEAHRRKHLDDLKREIAASLDQTRRVPQELFPEIFHQHAGQLREKVRELKNVDLPQFLARRMLLDRGGQIEQDLCDASENGRRLGEFLEQCRVTLAEHDCRVPAIEARLRYGWARESLAGVVTIPAERPVTVSDKIDRVLTNRVSGLLIFALLMLLVFQMIFSWAEPLMDSVESGQNAVAGLVERVLPHGMLRSLIVDGVIAGVGGVLIFLPQICLLFLFLALLEDCGYMARAAFLMDRLMLKLGLSGKSFVPLMSSFACAIPGVMATRVIENRRDRMITILIAPLMSCSARLPVYLLLIKAFVPERTLFEIGGYAFGLQGAVLFAMYCVGAGVAIPIAWLLKKFVFKGETPHFVMELPEYKFPSPRVVIDRVYDRGKAFVVRAGTLIFATSVLVWAAGYFPGDHSRQHTLAATIDSMKMIVERELIDQQRAESVVEILETLDEGAPLGDEQRARLAAWGGIPHDRPEPDLIASLPEWRTRSQAQAQRTRRAESRLEALLVEANELNSRLIAESYLGRAGHAIEPLVKPLGWDWKIGVGVIASFPAREVIISTLGTIYSLGGEVDEDDPGLLGALRAATWPDGRKVYNLPVALSIMVFFALCAQCAATLMVIKRETNSWRWPIFTFVYMTVLAYLGALLTYQTSVLWM
jgi:ferrous iron transport protein B